jgi:hypothetical protein
MKETKVTTTEGLTGIYGVWLIALVVIYLFTGLATAFGW